MSGSVLADAFSDANKPTVKPADYMEQMRQAGQVVEGLNANRLFQANTARGQLLQQAIDPKTGQLDVPTFNRLAAANPDIAQAMPEAMNQSQTLSTAQQTQAVERNTKILGVVGAALKAPPDQMHDMAAAGVQQLIDSKVIPADEGMRTLAKLPNDPGQLQTLLKQYQTSLLSPAEQRQAVVGTTGTVTGPNGALTGYVQQPADAPGAAGGAVSTPTQRGAPQGPSAETLSGVSTITNPDGSTTTDSLAGHQKAGRITPLGDIAPGYSAATASPAMVTALRGQEGTPDGRTSIAGARGQMQVTPGFFKQYAQPGESFDSKADVETVAKRGIAALEAKYPNDPARVATAYFSGEGNVAPAGSPTPYKQDIADANGTRTSAYVTGATGRYKAASADQTATAGAPKTGGTTVAGGTVDAIKQSAVESAKMGDQLVVRADQVPNNRANYGNMLADLEKLDTMGPGTAREAMINGAIQKLTGYGITMDKKQVAGAESFAKIANMIAAQQLGALGPTDARQSLAMGANPHLDLSKLGNTQILHMLQGNEDAIDAKARAWKDWVSGGHGPNTYRDFSIDFNHHFDPRVFQQQYMGDKEIGDLRKSLSATPGAAAKFADDVAYARQQKWIK